MASSKKPTIFFIHGSWHNPNHFRPIRDLFESNGYATECPLQPTFNAKPAPPVVSLEDDVKVIQAALTKLVEQGDDVIVVMHSYGGVLGSESVLESFGKKARQAGGLPGGVTQLVYMCAFLLPPGASLGTALGGGLPPFIKVEENGLCTMDEPERRFYNDLSKEDQDHWITELAPAPAIAQLTPVTYAAYQHYPATYLYCADDQALPLDLQQMMVKGTGVEFATETCNAGHSPFLSQPKTVLDIVKKLVA